ncbi:MAG: ATP-binding protein [Lachnospiraceae bacterium]|nr:ATP-binding protein [Lachnospiraceae bacterium]
MEYKPLPVGVENFEDMISEGYFYVDKTLFIRDVIDTKGKVTLCTRPRRFGKSLNISMLQYFLDINKKEHAYIFDGLKIKQAGNKYLAHQNKYPMIKLSLKGTEARNYTSALEKLKFEIAREFRQHDYLLDSPALNDAEKEFFAQMFARTASEEAYGSSLKILSEWLQRYHNEKVMILIDEYDVPLEKAYFAGYYEEMLTFIRGFFSEAFKTNDALYKAIITGCLRVSKESIFTGINNLNTVSILANLYDEYFGITEEEVVDALRYYGFEEKADETRAWYNGYVFGDATVYNPWSLVQYLQIMYHKERYPKPFWANTSSNSIVKELIQNADNDTKGEIELLMAGGTITKPIVEDVVYGEIRESMDNLWNFLFFTGYLKKVQSRFEDGRLYLDLKIPNQEIRYIYNRFIYEWFQQKVKVADFSDLYTAVRDGDVQTFHHILTDTLYQTMSFMDSGESFYHGFLLGVLRSMDGYFVKSNRESGSGRADIFVKPVSLRKRAIIIELKIANHIDELEKVCQVALQQIDDRDYAFELREEGYKEILKYGIAFYRKECEIVAGGV